MPEWSRKDERQYEHIKESARERGASTDRAQEIAARTVNKQRAQAGETKSSRGGRKTSGAKKASRSSSRSTRSSSSSRGRKSASKKR
jgi:plasmid stabilization system protein ParE